MICKLPHILLILMLFICVSFVVGFTSQKVGEENGRKETAELALNSLNIVRRCLEIQKIRNDFVEETIDGQKYIYNRILNPRFVDTNGGGKPKGTGHLDSLPDQ